MCERREAVAELRNAACQLSAACVVTLLGEKATAPLILPNMEIEALLEKLKEIPSTRGDSRGAL